MSGYRRNLSTIIVAISFITVALLGCSPQYDRSRITDTQSRGTYINVSGNYGDKIHAFTSSIGSVSDNSVNHYEFRNCGDRLFVKDDCSIYEIINDDFVEVLKHETYISDFIAATDDYIVFTSYKEDGKSSSGISFYVYYFSVDEIQELVSTEEYTVMSYYENDELIIAINNVNRIDKLWLVSDLDGEYQVAWLDSVSDLPNRYLVYGGDDFMVIEKRKVDGTTENTGLTSLERTYNDSIGSAIMQTKQHKGNVANRTLFNSSFEENKTRYNICHNYAADWSELVYWRKDVIEKYNVITDEGEVIFDDDTNYIVGYDFRTNAVYQLRMNDYMLISRSLDDLDNITEIQSFEVGARISFVWCENYLFWKYQKDDSETIDLRKMDLIEEEYGGVIKL